MSNFNEARSMYTVCIVRSEFSRLRYMKANLTLEVYAELYATVCCNLLSVNLKFENTIESVDLSDQRLC